MYVKACTRAVAEALGRSIGDFTTKIHAITDALGNPLNFILTEGQASDTGQAEALLQLTSAGAVALLGDKGYDSDTFIQAIQDRKMQVFHLETTGLHPDTVIGLSIKNAT